ncbi:hypothetical protein PIB30_086183 [Stylosanthes scabra]|uniref:Uncharacterized protein n=1 Tax=Stylosanthes scabra TaxID=79078 RepID=A0ABU6ZRP5_9FABA|nr:hypothetical protein [Stylosanthes scabra]
MVVSATEGTLKAQLTILVPDFDTSQISFVKDIVDGKGKEEVLRVEPSEVGSVPASREFFPVVPLQLVGG